MLNLHEGYRPAPPSILDAFALIVREAERDTPAFREAARRVRSWPGIAPALRGARSRSIPDPAARRLTKSATSAGSTST